MIPGTSIEMNITQCLGIESVSAQPSNYITAATLRHLLAQFVVVLTWHGEYNRTSVGNNTCFYLHFSDVSHCIEPTSTYNVDNFNLTQYCSCHRLFVEHNFETMYWPHL